MAEFFNGLLGARADKKERHVESVASLLRVAENHSSRRETRHEHPDSMEHDPTRPPRSPLRTVVGIQRSRAAYRNRAAIRHVATADAISADVAITPALQLANCAFFATRSCIAARDGEVPSRKKGLACSDGLLHQPIFGKET